MSTRSRFDKFDESARKTLNFAQVVAQRFNHSYIGTEHLLLGLLEVSGSTALLMLESMGVEPQKVREATEFIIGRGDRRVVGEIGLTPRAKKVIELAVDESRQMTAGYIGTEHILLGLIREGEGIAAGVLESLGVTLAKAHHHAYLVLEAGTPAQGTERAEDRQPGIPDQSGSILNIASTEPDYFSVTRVAASPQERYDPLTGRARKALNFAQEESSRLAQAYVGTEHLLLGLLDVPDCVAMQVLDHMGADPDTIRRAVEFVINRPDRKITGGEIGLTPRAKKAMELARDEARRMNLLYVGTEHLLLGLIREGEGIGAGVLASVGVTLESTRYHTIALLGIQDLLQGTTESDASSPAKGSYHFSLQSSERLEPPSDGTITRIPSQRSTIPFEKFTERARKALSLAQEEAQRFQHNYIGTEHLLLALVRQQDGVASSALQKFGVDLSKARSVVEFIIGRGDRIVLGEIGLTPRARRVLDLAVEEAGELHHSYIGTEHLLLGLIHEGEGIAVGVLESLGVSLERLHDETIKAIKPEQASERKPADAGQETPPETPES